MAVQKNNQGKGQDSPVDKVRLRVSTMINSPRAQAERRASIWKAQGDSEEAWQQVLEELAETEGLEMTRNEDGTVLLTWQSSEEEGADAGGEEVYSEEMVVQHVHEVPAPF
ncbi:TPA: DUF1654 domain-containing protein [Pseudomonas aeruginosa]|uniref:DUF1654 domain-containing protein n=1 Tax=Pseudomonas aeruginosa TaxID=287 RepID=UPI001012074E|nr:DUF1654 domain-containing protein [Pseudomonas aeruginosa]ELP1332956.1 DUF1654 domain-containing protein [Pseudomonas aeruginosa]MDG3697020.1 DUF1654 domain-containing protein [Pseudomonas aeruginosa]